ncbi:MAG: 16S rRNA (cytosine(967)-C(5))-methyltransferase RsmB [Clostridia bacterium]|nr:16S rRNA (cytosine(967)-C(5))-methyltransferase RsmB [Clostridia bacterium]
MDSLNRNLITLKALSAVYREGAYSGIALNEKLAEVKDKTDRAYITRLFYGVLAKEVQLDYIVGKLTTKRPKPIAVILIKIGLYQLRYMSQPDYAVIDTIVKLAGKIGKREIGGFINAVLRSSNSVVLPITDADKIKEISVNYYCPAWLVEKLIADYGVDFTQAFLSAEVSERTHIRINKGTVNEEEFVKSVNGKPSGVGYFVDYEKLKKYPPYAYAVQGKSSVLACRYYSIGVNKGDSVLDLCSAPGGKAMYMASIGAVVTACDIHPHRVKLIESYAENQRLTVKTMVNDGAVFRPEFSEKFDCVIVDAPCSGIGTLYSKPDVLFGKSQADIDALSKLQLSILSTASGYVKKGGYLNYSTCTVLSDENEQVVTKFLATHPEFEIEITGDEVIKSDSDGFVRLYPHLNDCDGFFVAKLRRKND